MKLLALCLVLLPFLSQAQAQPQSQQQPISSATIDSLVERTLKAFEVPGIAVAVIKDGKIVHSKGYGVRSLATRQPVDENTLFGIASNSKAFTTAALGILVDEGKLDWDDKVRKYIPEFQLADPYVTEEFTIRDLLTHRSGLGLGAGDLMFFPDSSDFTIKDILYNLRFFKPVTSFRAQYAYDNNLYIVAGEVIARISGMSWDEFVERRIIRQIGMDHSAACYDRLTDSSNVIDAHARVEGKVQVIARSRSKVDHAAGAIYSCISDLSKWVLLHLAEGKYGPDKKQLLSQKTFRERWTPQTLMGGAGGPYNTHFVTYGLGFLLMDAKGYLQVSHTGGLEGMVTQITMIPELQLGIIVLTNQEEDLAYIAVTNQIKDAYLGITGKDRVKDYAAYSKKERQEDKHLTDSIWLEVNKAIAQSAKAGKTDLSIYTGQYSDPWLGEITISTSNNKLFFKSKRSPKLEGEMLPYKGNTFVVKWRERSMNADAWLTFRLDETGKAEGITMKPLSPLTDFSYDFQDLEFHRIL